MLTLKKVAFKYNDDPDGFTLNDIYLVVNPGEFVTILGPNGSGKSTLLNLILGISTPNSGEILFEGKNYKTFSRKELAKRISFVPQKYYSVYPFSIFEIVAMGRTPYLNFLGFEKDDDIKKINNVLDLVGISHLKNKSINSVSGGEAQRAFIARALVQEPDLILLDEPNAHLDLEHQISIFDLLKSLNNEKKLTIIMVSHDLNLSGCYSHRMIFMKDGKIYLDDIKHKVLTEENISAVFNVNAKIYNYGNNINVAIFPNN
ncbi:MAG: ABC transporter ATP-binding protein [Melioribacteraceae bacterium]|nr:ABC transporter ATP-binding protein [Melioribacteraceae bacterium]RJP59490.1 MAG: ABC transporter ATP-binding protein [Ignavibacteriales bacterium]WKZ68313.1 MAG: ABC transporter ATP-binding protein [Melioribacteraceae bacterium]